MFYWNRVEKTTKTQRTQRILKIFVLFVSLWFFLGMQGQPSVSIDDATVIEGDSGLTSAVFTIRLSAPSATEVTVNISTADGTATVGSDYQARTGSFTFPAGTTSRTITVPVIGDNTNEPDETFFVNILSATNATISDARAVGTIDNDDPTPTVSINNVAIMEGDAATTSFIFSVKLSNPSQDIVTVNFATSDGTAQAGSDYTAVSGTLTFPPRETARPVTVAVNGDKLRESNETFFVNLSNPNGLVIGVAQGIGSIINDDSLPELSIKDVSLQEGDTGTSAAVFTVSLLNPGPDTVTVDYETVDGTAQAGSDYVSNSGKLTFTSGDVQETITVLVNGDTLVEPNETFFVTLKNPTGATTTRSQGTAIITNDDQPPPSFSIDDVSVTEGNAGATGATFSISLSRPSSQTIMVNFATADGTAVAGSDYLPASGVLTFAPGITRLPLTITVNDDTNVELNETFFVNLTNPVNATIEDGQGRGTIINDDSGPTVFLQFSSSSYSASEDSIAIITVTRTGSAAGAVTVNYATSNGTAKAGLDYKDSAGTLSFASGDISPKTFAITILKDNLVEAEETINLVLSSPVGGAAFGGPSTAMLKIIDLAPANPSISNFSPASGLAGTAVTITGVNLTGAKAVRFKETDADFSVVSDDTITATVPAGAGSGPISVRTPAGTATSSTIFIVTQIGGPPSIGSIFPRNGPVGASITIAGENFTGATAVIFSKNIAVQPSGFIVSSDGTQITINVPAGTETGKITVVTPAGITASGDTFTLSDETRDFLLSATPDTESIAPGASANLIIDAEPLGNFSETVVLATSISPPGSDLIVNFSSNTITPGGNATLTIKTTAGTPVSTYTIKIIGITEKLVSSATVVLRVETKDFEMSMTPVSQAIKPGASSNFVIDLRKIGDFSEPVSLSASITPADGNVTASLSSSMLMPGGSTNLIINSTAGTPDSRYTITLTGTASQLTHTVAATLAVNPEGKDFDFLIGPDSQTITRGTSAKFSINVKPVGTFSEPVSLFISASPPNSNLIMKLSSNTVMLDGSETLTIDATEETPLTTISITVRGMAGQLIRTATVKLIVKAETKDFSFSIAPGTQTITSGATTSFSINIQPIGSFSEEIKLTKVLTPTNSGVDIVLAPETVLLGPNGTNATMRVSTTQDVPTTIFTITVIAKSGQLVRTATSTINVLGSDFSLGFNPPQVTVSRGNKVKVTANINRSGGFSGSVTVAPDEERLKMLKIKAVQVSQSTTGMSLSFDLKIKKKAILGSQQITFTGRDELGRIRTGILTLVIE
jgi:hypothetical protein